MLKIKRLSFSDHPILGNLSLDFTDRNGKPLDTIIIAGENGTGKTTILETIYASLNLRDLWTPLENGFLKPGTRIQLDVPNEFFSILSRLYSLGDLSCCDTLELTIREGEHAWSRAHAKALNGRDALRSFEASYLSDDRISSKSKVLFNDAQVNFDLNPISHVTTSKLDDPFFSKRSTTQMPTEIAQLLVDIQAADSQDLAIWVDRNKGKVPPEEIQRIRISRFDRAFSKMIEGFRFLETKNEDGFKRVYFSKRGKRIPLEHLSSGEKQIVFRGGFILKDIKNDEPPVLLVDEPELSLHPEWQKTILEFYKQLLCNEEGRQQSQLFVVTHSPFIIHNDTRYNDKVIVLRHADDGSIEVLDKPEYYSCTSRAVVADAFHIDVCGNAENVPVVFVEGETDEKYMREAIRLFGIKGEVDISCIGSKTASGSTGCGFVMLDKGFAFLQHNPKICPHGALFLYDSDVKGKKESVGIVHAAKMPSRNNSLGIKAGIENLVDFPDTFDLTPFITETETYDSYSIPSIQRRLDKTKLCDYICEKISENERRLMLEPLCQNIALIEHHLLSE